MVVVYALQAQPVAVGAGFMLPACWGTEALKLCKMEVPVPSVHHSFVTWQGFGTTSCCVVNMIWTARQCQQSMYIPWCGCGTLHTSRMKSQLVYSRFAIQASSVCWYNREMYMGCKALLQSKVVQQHGVRRLVGAPLLCPGLAHRLDMLTCTKDHLKHKAADTCPVKTLMLISKQCNQ